MIFYKAKILWEMKLQMSLLSSLHYVYKSDRDRKHCGLFLFVYDNIVITKVILTGK